jgi:O-antigen/teichoic acid export membrane protein
VPSLKRNLIANYAGQVFTSVVGIVMLPIFMQYLGAESYGLVGFFAMLQAWSLLLDMGMTPTMSRELARFSAGALAQDKVATMIRTMEWIFAGLGLVCAWGVSLSADWAAHDWLKARQLSHDEVALSIALMGGMMGIGWLGGIYRAGLVGLERMVLLNIALAISTMVRSVGGWLVLKYVSTLPSTYFTFHLVVSVAEVIMYRILFYRRFSMTSAAFWPQLRSLHGSKAMAGGMAFLATLWIVVSQSDRLILSWLLDLPAFGSFTVAVSLAGGINQLAAPMLQAVQPRFVALVAQGQTKELEELYRTSTQLMTAGIFAVVGIFTFFPGPLLLAWTGDAEVSQRAAGILPLYALGNGVVSLLSLAFAVQFAFGRLRWHIIGTCVLGLFWIPGGYLAARYAGAVGTGWMWLLCNTAYFLFGLSYIHSRLLPGFWRRWLVVDIGLVILAECIFLAVSRCVGLPFSSRLKVLAALGSATLFIAGVGMLVAPQARRHGIETLRRLRLHFSRLGIG